MKKKMLIVTAVLLILIGVLIIGTGRDEPLEPAAAAALQFQVPEAAPEDNAYVGISGLGYIDDGDVVAAGLKYLNRDPQKEAPPAPASEFFYQNPCLARMEVNPDCLEGLVADAAAINEDVLKNSRILERYRAVLKMPLFVNTSSDFSSPMPLYQAIIQAARLTGAKSLLDIKQSGLAAGLDSLERELEFYKRMGQSEYVGLVDLMIAVAVLNMKFAELAKIIEDGQTDLSGYEQRLRKMTGLDFDAGRMMAAALNTEKREHLRTLNDLPGAWFGDAPGRKIKLGEKLHWFLFKKNMTLNRIAARADAVIARFREAPLEGFPDYYEQVLARRDEMEPPDDSRLEIKNLYNEYGIFFFKNQTGEMLLGMAEPEYGRYLARINDTLVKARLVRAQLELRLMDPRPENFTEALAGLGPETWNPYTGRPFDWDAEKKVIRAEGADAASGLQGPGHSGRKMEAGLPDRRP